MTRVHGCHMLSLCLLLFVLIFGSQACQVKVWQDSQYRGDWRTFTTTNDLPSRWVNSISSLEVDSGCGVIVYRKRYFTGGRSFFEGSIPKLSSYSLNDQIMSLKVFSLTQDKCGVILYSDSNYRGKSQYYPANNLPTSFDIADKSLYESNYYSSLKIIGSDAASCAVVAWDNSRLSGSNRYFNGPQHYTFGDFNDRISSFSIINKATTCAVVFYKDSNFNGDARCYSTSMDHLDGQNDSFSSIRVLGTDQCSVTVFKDAKRTLGSELETFKGGESASFSNGMNDVISSFNIGKIMV